MKMRHYGTAVLETCYREAADTSPNRFLTEVCGEHQEQQQKKSSESLGQLLTMWANRK